jgi:hypothetical protein
MGLSKGLHTNGVFNPSSFAEAALGMWIVWVRPPAISWGNLPKKKKPNDIGRGSSWN